MLVTGSGPASASALTPAGSASSSFHPYGPGGGHGWGCDPWQRERWDLNGSNTVDLVYNSGNYTYGVTFRQDGSCLRGTLTDLGIPNGPTTGPIFGTVTRNRVTFSFRYTYTGEVQGTRTFTGTIGRWGAVNGTWDETGTENGHGTWSLARRAHPACSPSIWWWSPRHECIVRS